MQCVLSYDIIAECIVSFIVIKHLQLVFVWKMCVDSELAMLSQIPVKAEEVLQAVFRMVREGGHYGASRVGRVYSYFQSPASPSVCSFFN